MITKAAMDADSMGDGSRAPASADRARTVNEAATAVRGANPAAVTVWSHGRHGGRPPGHMP